MRHGSSTLRLIALLIGVTANAAAQQEPKPQDLPNAPVAKQESAPQKRQNHLNTTIEVLGRRSIFFPNIATSRGALSTKQKFELFADESVAPSRFLSSAARAWEGTENVSALRWPRGRRTISSGRFWSRPCCTVIRAIS